ncbi:hypothetical protein AC578_1960 [Pseudocercospora eumusae]|uniref:Apple domain-containing protein n=1 Tax=Pseudocercospora eumusae TaxID=321146 RepID=A0A139H2G2_9PEZI|nr:hypothetical protein AC578_1960 [Pseudocercospora eumusae]
MHFKDILLATALSATVLASNPYSKKCRFDNCLASAVSANKGLSMCSTYFQSTVTPAPVTSTTISSVISTIVTTTSPVTTSTSTISETATEYRDVTSTDTTTSTQIDTTTETDTITSTETVTTTTTSTVTAIPTNAGNGDTGLKKRGGHGLPSRGKTGPLCHRPKPPPFNACSKIAQGYSSACKCLGATTSTKMLPTSTVTVTVSTTSSSTSVVTAIQTTVVSTTVTSTTTDFKTDVATSTVTQTSISTQTTSVTTTSTSTSTATTTTTIVPSPTCSAITESGGQYIYRNQYSGSNTLNPNNSGNTAGSGGAKTQSYSGTLDVCSAAQQCANFASSSTSPLGAVFFTFNLYFTEDQQNWQCKAYYDPASSSDYNVVDPNVKYSYGWTTQ